MPYPIGSRPSSPRLLAAAAVTAAGLVAAAAPGFAAAPVGPAAPAAAAAPAADADTLRRGGRAYPLYPASLAERPDVPSPLATPDGREIVLVGLRGGEFALVPVTQETSERRGRQLHVDADDFPALARTGLHDQARLDTLRAITGRPVDEITALARPGGLSSDGFLAEDEDIVSTLKGDDRLVRALGLTHPELARPLFHVWNLIQTDLELDRWHMATHSWENVDSLLYHDGWIGLEAHDTKGGQKSIFADGLDGGFWIVISRPLAPQERAFLRESYPDLPAEELAEVERRLTSILTGEMEPHYVMWYGFYEGHTGWRVDPLAVARIFGLRTLRELEAAFPGRLPSALLDHHRRE